MSEYDNDGGHASAEKQSFGACPPESEGKEFVSLLWGDRCWRTQ